MTKNLTLAPWKYSFTSAADARKRQPGTDGGGASGSIYRPTGKFLMGCELNDTLAFAPHHRDPAEDGEREDVLRLMAAAPELLAALMESMPAIRHAVTVAEIGTRSTRDPATYGKRVVELAEAKQRLARAQAAIDKATKPES